MDFLTTIDAECLLAINGWYSAWADSFMYAFSGKWVWIPMYASILYLLFRNLHWKVALVAVITVVMTITFADQVCSSLIRPFAERLRPANLENSLSQWVHIVNGYRGGRYGFPSCHAANTFGLAFFVYYLVHYRWLTSFMMFWAMVTCYSRAYLGVHYPGDLLVGAIVGWAGAWLCCRLFHQLTAKYLSYQSPTSFRHGYIPIGVGCLTILLIAIYASVTLLV